MKKSALGSLYLNNSSIEISYHNALGFGSLNNSTEIKTNGPYNFVWTNSPIP